MRSPRSVSLFIRCASNCAAGARPRTAVEGTFSVYHWVAVALIERAIGIRHFSDAMVNDPAIAALRDRIEARPDPAYAQGRGGSRGRAATTAAVLERHVDHALGAIERPPSDAELGAKLADLVGGILPPTRAAALAGACWALAGAPDAGLLLRSAIPG